MCQTLISVKNKTKIFFTFFEPFFATIFQPSLAPKLLKLLVLFFFQLAGIEKLGLEFAFKSIPIF